MQISVTDGVQDQLFVFVSNAWGAFGGDSSELCCWLGFGFTDPTGTAFDSDALPGTAPPLSAFTDADFEVNMQFEPVAFDTIGGRITSLRGPGVGGATETSRTAGETTAARREAAAPRRAYDVRQARRRGTCRGAKSGLG